MALCEEEWYYKGSACIFKFDVTRYLVRSSRTPRKRYRIWTAYRLWVNPNLESIHLFGGEADSSAGELSGGLYAPNNGNVRGSLDLGYQGGEVEDGKAFGNIPCPRSLAA
ncbi:hypothetical protein GALMADRAFT_216711 [Galerina marginata CBS 339.88]|uniref:Uncharacterized protein n=1 Tax=Galerina marginata (strain CBS 339.88) TaxID=685588 RepID=A0A067SH55_GALM3|nr:hypothetical protein GALMADRAFT_216711 [Galerina marginata CBS 339.88]